MLPSVQVVKVDGTKDESQLACHYSRTVSLFLIPPAQRWSVRLTDLISSGVNNLNLIIKLDYCVIKQFEMQNVKQGQTLPC